MKLSIEQADNGYVLSYQEIPDGGSQQEIRYITVEDTTKNCDCPSEARITQKLLFEVCEFFGLLGSKHDEERIHISVVNQKGGEIE